MSHRYGIYVVEDSDPRVVCEDVEMALEKQGLQLSPSDTLLDDNMDEDGSTYFILETPCVIKQRKLKADLETLDGVTRCKVRVEAL